MEATDKEANDLQPDSLWPEIWKVMSEASKREEKSKSGLSKNRSLTMLENFVVFTSLIQQMKNSRRL